MVRIGCYSTHKAGSGRQVPNGEQKQKVLWLLLFTTAALQDVVLHVGDADTCFGGGGEPREVFVVEF